MKTQTRTSGTDGAALGPGAVRVGSLPAALPTDHAPERSVESEHARAEALAALARSIAFDVATYADAPRSAGDRAAGAAKDREQIDSWRSEGGHGS